MGFFLFIQIIKLSHLKPMFWDLALRLFHFWFQHSEPKLMNSKLFKIVLNL